VARAIHRFKYEDKPELAHPLGALVAQLAGTYLFESKGVVVPVPLHEKRYRERKYDHAMLLAVELARAAERKVPDEALVRVVDTPRQVGLTDEERVKNVQQAFWASSAVKGEDVLLVDDVLTTGATAHAAATVLLAAGARSVRVLSIARAVLRNT
jgi:ComF family protein